MSVLESDFQYEKLKKKIAEDMGFQTQHYGDKHLKRRFNVRMRSVGAKTPREYMRILDKDSSEYPKLINALTVNVTEWFRNPEVFEVIKKRVIPEIISTKRAKSSSSMRIWSVGCSDGKEPYSLAMCVKEVLKDDNFHTMIFAWDIDELMLKKAKAGLYKKDDLKGLEARKLKKFFIEESGKFRVRPEIKSMVKFEKRDLHKDKKHSAIDLIVCRNVVIYLTKPRKAALYIELYNCLRKEGFFVMGKSETLVGQARNMFKSIDNVNRIYRK